MKFKNTAEALYIQAKEILDSIAKVETSGDIHSIELDLLLEKLRNIYDLVNDMKESISTEKSSELSDSFELGVEKVLDPEPENVPPPEDSIEKVEENEEAEVDANSNEAEKSDGISNISERFKTSEPTLNEKMEGKSQKENISAQMNLTPISNISGAIGLNEKFELINELFSGDKNQFESTLDVLNKADSFVEAYNYLNDNFDWDMDSIYVQRILELIRRKLIVRRNEQ